ncbi:hypothetical protein [Allosphingosinicella deserti]|uniref:Flagellar protein FliT n=1 Tax=Allosphingosinicella deserti TaxID=2116704 RepID=A0A2P7QNY6_9SPHN|nr:hypothetical protein [Sphingomonas deserti]PSJ39664.1 hypothetical protein C7I55_13805 [Sphingomonas deserti]
MSLHALGRLEAAHERLIRALDHEDVAMLERRVEDLRSAIDDVRSHGAWRDEGEVRERAERITRLADAARIRVNFLTDITRQRLQRIGDVRGQSAIGTYSRPA